MTCDKPDWSLDCFHEKRTSVHPMQQIDDIVPPSMSMFLNKDEYVASRYVNMPWGLFDRYAQSFKAT